MRNERGPTLGHDAMRYDTTICLRFFSFLFLFLWWLGPLEQLLLLFALFARFFLEWLYQLLADGNTWN